METQFTSQNLTEPFGSAGKLGEAVCWTPLILNLVGRKERDWIKKSTLSSSLHVSLTPENSVHMLALQELIVFLLIHLRLAYGERLFLADPLRVGPHWWTNQGPPYLAPQDALNKKKRKKKMQKVDPSILGFSVNAADRVNMGEIQTVED